MINNNQKSDSINYRPFVQSYLGRILFQNVWITQLKIRELQFGLGEQILQILILNRWNERILLLTVVNITFELNYYYFSFLMSGWVVRTGTM